MTALIYLEGLAVLMVLLAVGGAIVENNAAAGRAFDRLGRWLFDR